MIKFPFLGNQIGKLNVFFQHKLFKFSQVKFDEISMKYFYLEYYAYEQFIKSETKPFSNIGETFENKINKPQNKFKKPMVKTQSSEFFNLDQSKRSVSISKYDNIQRVSDISDKIIDMGWIYFIEESCNKILYALIDKKLSKYERITNKPVLKTIHEWFQTVVLKFLGRILEREHVSKIQASFSQHIRKQMYDQWKVKLEYYLNDKFARMRYSKLFDLKNMDKYQYSLEDLKQVLDKTDVLEEFSYKLKDDFENTLLVPGMQTTSIIKQYIKAIRILRILDSSQVCLEIVSEPIKEYLRSRKDTLKCIIDIVINQENSDIYNELGQQYTQIPLKYSGKQEESKNARIFREPNVKNKTQEGTTSIIEDVNDEILYISSDEDEEAAKNWKPAPLNAAGNRHISTKFLKSDIISTLVNIYGSKDQFLEEYRSMLCGRLLNKKEFNIDKECENIELLKSRFGDSSVKYCDIMLKDIKDSRKMITDYVTRSKENNQINNFSEDNLLQLNDFDVIVISKDYWDITVDDAQFKHPYTVSEPFDHYSKDFSEKDKYREVKYLSNLGNVQLSLTFDNGSFDFNVSPIHAAIISIFNETDDKLTAEYLAEKLSITTTLLEEKIAFWVNKGVLIEEQTRSSIAEFASRANNITGDQAGVATYYYCAKELRPY